jgi:hypothetical protein
VSGLIVERSRAAWSSDSLQCTGFPFISLCGGLLSQCPKHLDLAAQSCNVIVSLVRFMNSGGLLSVWLPQQRRSGSHGAHDPGKYTRESWCCPESMRRDTIHFHCNRHSNKCQNGRKKADRDRNYNIQAEFHL